MLRYPTISSGQADELIRQLVGGTDVSIDAICRWRGSGESVDFDPLEMLVDEWQERLARLGSDPDQITDKEPFEGELAVALYSFFSSIPVEVKDDPDFWTYLAFRYFWWFISWRESASIERGNVSTYTNGRRNTESIPLRLYLRAKAVDVDGDVIPAQVLTECTDFWRSHVTRVRTATAPVLTRELVEMQAGSDRLPTVALRAFARRLNRSWTNVMLSLYDEPRAAGLVRELRD